MRLYSYWRSSCSYRVRIALEHKGIDYEYVPINLVKDGGEQHMDAYLEKNPVAQVPVIEFMEGGKTRRLAQSMAICEFLDARFPNAPLVPKDLYLGAKARQLAETINAGIQPLQNLRVMKRLGELAPELDTREWCRDWIAIGFEALERGAAELSGSYLVGEEVSIADLCLVPQMYNARRFDMDLGPYPTLRRVDAACRVLPAFGRAHPDKQPDALPPESR